MKQATKHDFFRTPLGIAAIAALVCLGAQLRVANVSNLRSRSPDEREYSIQAKTLLRRGQAGLRGVVAEYQHNPFLQFYPSPTRVGYLWALAGAMRLTGGTDERVGAYLSCAASIGSFFVIALIGIRFFPSWATFFALLFFAVSPMELAISRRAWTDALAEFLGVSLVYVAAEITCNSARRAWYLLFVLLGSLGVAVKESGLIGYSLCAIWVLCVLLIERREWVNGAILVAGGLGGLAMTIGWLASYVGGLSIFAKIVTSIPISNAQNPYAIDYQSGPGYLMLRALEIMSPAAAVLGLAGLGVVLFSRRTLKLLDAPDEVANWQVVRWITFFMLAYIAVPMVLPHWLNLRYISVIFGPFYLIAGIGFWYCVSLCSNRLKRFYPRIFAGLAIAALLIGAVADYARFQRIFVRDAVMDLSVKVVLDADKGN